MSMRKDLVIYVCLLMIVVGAQNECPSFLNRGDVDVAEDQGSVEVVAWAFAVSQGSNETSQVLSWPINNTNNSLFDVQPRIEWNASVPTEAVLLFSIKPNTFGSAVVSVNAKDDGGVGNGGCDSSAVTTFKINIVPQNDKPSFIAGSLFVSVNEDVGPVTLSGWATSVTAGANEDATQTTSFILTFLDSTNSSVFSIPPSISSDGTLTFTPAPNATTHKGACLMYVQLRDSGGSPPNDRSCDPVSSCPVIKIEIVPVNDAPSFTTTTGMLSFWEDMTNIHNADSSLCYEHKHFAVDISHGAGDSEADQTVSFTVSVDDASLFRVQPAVWVNGSLTFCLQRYASGTSQVSVRIVDSGPSPNLGTLAIITIDVLSVNNAPTFTAGASSISINRNDPAANHSGLLHNILPGPAAAADESSQKVSALVSCSPSSLATASAYITGSTLILELSVVPEAFGNGTVTVVLNDDGGTDRGGTDSVTITLPLEVTFVSNIPTLSLLHNVINVSQAVGISNGSNTKYAFPGFVTNVSPGVGDSNVETMTLSASTSASFVSGPIVEGSLMYFIVAPTYAGRTLLTFEVTDSSGLFVVSTVDTTVRAINGCPTFDFEGDVTIEEDSGLQAYTAFFSNISRGSSAENSQVLTWSISTQPSMFSAQPSITFVATETVASLSFRVKADFWGSIPVKIALHDDGSTSDGGCVESSKNFTIHVTAVNDRPSFNVPHPSVRVVEDAGFVAVPMFAQNITFGALEPLQHGYFNLTLENPTQSVLFDVTPTVSTDGTLTFTTAANRNTYNGSVNFRLQLVDNDKSLTSWSCEYVLCPLYTISIDPINDLPSFLKGSDIVVWEDLLNMASTSNRTFVEDGWARSISIGTAIEEYEAQVPDFHVSTNDTTMFDAQPSLSGNGTLTFQLREHFNGVANVSVSLFDGGPTPNEGTPTWFLIVVLAVNDIPTLTLSNTGTLILDENAARSILSGFGTNLWPGPLGVSDEAAQELTVTVSSNPSDLFTWINLTQLAGGQASLEVEPAPFKFGNATCFIAVQDTGGIDRGGQDTLVLNFTVEVKDVNDPPSLNLNRTLISVLEDSYPNGYTLLNFAFNISSHSMENSYQGYTISITNSNPQLFSQQPEVDTFGTLFFTPEGDEFGDATVYVAVTDHGTPPLSANETFMISITSVNDCPSFSHGGTITVDESSGVQSYPTWATNVRRGPSNEDSQKLMWKVTTNNDQLFEVLPEIVTSGTNGALSFRPKTEESGIATVTVVLQDDGGTTAGGCDQSNSVSFLIVINSVNQVPTFVAGQNPIQVAEDSGFVSKPGWATSISAGASNEANQALWFELTFINASQASLFKTVPQIASDTGVLSFEAYENINTIDGHVKLYVRLFDNGNATPTPSCSPLENCGVLEIIISPVNDPPTFVASTNEFVVWEDLGNFASPAGDLTHQFDYAQLISPGNEMERTSEHQTVSFAVMVNSNNNIFATPPALLPNGTLVIQLSPNKNGVATLQVQIRDSGPSPNVGVTQSLKFTVLSVNDPPELRLSSAVFEVAEDSGTASIENIFTSIFPGPTVAVDEIDQILSYTISVQNATDADFFTVVPTMDVSVPSKPRLTFQPGVDKVGNATLQMLVEDNGGTSRGGQNSVLLTLFIRVIAVNDAPSFKLSQETIIVDEDASQYILNGLMFDVSAGPGEKQALSVHWSTSHPLLFSSQPNVTVSGSLGGLVFTPAANAFGTSYVDIFVTDSGSPILSSAASRVTIKISSINDPPHFDILQNVNVSGCTSSADCVVNIPSFISNVSGGAKNENPSLSFTIPLSTAAVSLFDKAPAILSDNTLSFTLKQGAHTFNNPVYMTVTGEDEDGTTNGGVNSFTRSFFLDVKPIIAAPTFDAPTTLSINVREDSSVVIIDPFVTNIGRSGFPTSTLSFVVDVFQPNLFARQPVVTVNNDGETATLIFQPVSDVFGVANLNVMIVDPDTGKNGTTTPFTINIVPVNDPPAFSLSDVSVYEDSGSSHHRIIHNLTLGNMEYDTIVSVSIQCTDSSLFRSAPTISSDGIVAIDVTPKQSGSTGCTVTVEDSAGTNNGGVSTTSKLMYIRVQRLNRSPQFVPGGDITVLEDSETYSSVWATGISAGEGESTQKTSFLFSCTFDELFFAPPSLSGSGSLLFRPNPNMNGVSTCLVELFDDGPSDRPNSNSSGRVSFTIRVVPVNDPPSFIRGPDIQGKASDDLLRVERWARNISAGPLDERQALKFVFKNLASPHAFSREPSIEFSSQEEADFVVGLNRTFSGFVTVDVCLVDDGGSENNGIDHLCRTISVSVTAAAASPQFTLLQVIELREDTPPSLVERWITSLSPTDIVLTINCSANLVLDGHPEITARENLLVKVLPDAFGTVVCTVQGETPEEVKKEEFVVNVIPVNDAPSFSTNETTVSVLQGESISRVIVTEKAAGPANERWQQTMFVILPSVHQAAYFQTPPVLSQEGTVFISMSKTAPAGLYELKLFITDDGGTLNGGVNVSAVSLLIINVMFNNRAPSFLIQRPQLTVLESDDEYRFSGWISAVSPGSTAEEDQTVTFEINTTQPSLFFKPPALNLSTMEMSFTAAPDRFGQCTIVVTAIDSLGLRSTATAQLVIVNINDSPSFTHKGNVTVAEDTTTIVSKWATAVSVGLFESAVQSAAFTTLEYDQNLIDTLTVDEQSGNLVVVPSPNAFGVTTARIQLHDDGGVAFNGQDSFAVLINIHVEPRNDPPTLVVAGNIDVGSITSGKLVSIPAWLQEAAPGPLSESHQTLQVVVSVENPSMFSTLPFLDMTSGSLQFAARIAGQSEATITATDELGSSTFVNFNLTVDDVQVSLDFKTLFKNWTVNAGSVAALPFVESGTQSQEISHFVVNIVNSDTSLLFAAAPVIDASGVMKFETNYMNGRAILAIEAVGPNNTRSVVPVSVTIVVRIPIGVSVKLSTSIEAFDGSFFRRVIADRYNVSQSAVVIVSVVEGSTIVTFYIKETDWYATATTVASELQDSSGSVSVLLGVQSASTVELDEVAATPQPSVETPLPTSAPQSTASPSSSGQNTTAGEQPNHKRIDTWFHWVLYVAVGIAVLAIIVVFFTCLAIRRKRKQTKQLFGDAPCSIVSPAASDRI